MLGYAEENTILDVSCGAGVGVGVGVGVEEEEEASVIVVNVDPPFVLKGCVEKEAFGDVLVLELLMMMTVLEAPEPLGPLAAPGSPVPGIAVCEGNVWMVDGVDVAPVDVILGWKLGIEPEMELW